MADNTTLNSGTGGDVIATDDLTTINGGAVAGVKVQRIKSGFGADGSLRDVDTAGNGLPVSIRDSSGNAATSISDGGGGVGIGVAGMATNFVVSAVNSSTVQLAAGATFTGAVETIFNQQAISILLTADQPCTLTFNEYIDSGGARKCGSMTYTVFANSGFNRAITANGNYYNITVTNTGLSATTTLNLNVAQGTLDSVTNLGNLPVSLNEVNTVPISARPDGFVRTAFDPTTLLFDSFETVDTTNTWTLGGTNPPTGSAGAVVLNAGTTANATSYSISKPSFTPGTSAYLQFANIVTIEAGSVTGAVRFFGLGTITVPTTTAPIQNGSIFELTSTNTLLGSVYSGGVRTATVNLVKPVDGLNHRYAIYYKGSRVYFEIDNVLQDSIGFPNPQVGALNLVFGQVNSAAVTGTPTTTLSLVGVGDTARNATKIADSKYPWRQQTVSSAGAALVDVNAGTNRMGTVQLTGGTTSAALGLGSTVSPYGYVRATLEPGSLFYDPFDGAAIDTTNRWNTAVATGMSISQATGALTVTTTTTISNSLYIDTQPTFACEGLSFKIFGTAAKFEAQSANLFALNQHRYFGFGDRPGAFAATTPLGNAVGFELFTDGKLYACLYSGGTRIFSSATDLLGNTLNSLILPSAGYVRFAVEMRADAIFWYVNSTEYPAVKYDITTAGFSLPQLQALPIRIHAVNAASGTVGASTFAFTAAAVTDSGKNSTHLSDGTYHWRKASVGKQGGLKVSGASITGASGAIAAAGTGTVGPLDVSEAGTVTFIAKNTIAASAWAGAPVLVFEQSDDNVSWAPLTTVRSDTNAANTTFILGPNTANTSIMFDAALEGVNYVRCRVTTGPTTNGMTISIQPGGLAFTPIVSVIERKDAGRIPFVWYTESLAGAAAEALVTMTAATAVGTTGIAATTYTVPAGKTLRLTSMQVSFVSTSTTANTTKLRIRALASGAALVTSPIIWSTPRIGWQSATFIANEVTTLNFDFPDGFEFAASNSIGLTHIEAAANGTVDIMITGFLY